MPQIDLGNALALAVVRASHAPLLLLNEKMLVVAASGSFCTAFGLDPATVTGLRLYDLDRCHWAMPRLRSRLDATLKGVTGPIALELELGTSDGDLRHVVIKARMLDYGDANCPRMLVAIADVTNVKRQTGLSSDAEPLLEGQLRVISSLRIIAGILMHSTNARIDRYFE